MAIQVNANVDQFAVSLAEEYRQVVDDNVYGSNIVLQDTWDDAEERNPGRWLAVPILTGKNANAIAFGQYDPLPAAAQTIVSAAQFPWTFYTVAVNMSWQELRMIQGPNERTDLLAVQLENSIASMNDLMGNDLTNLQKGPSTTNGVNMLGIVEATDNGSLVNVYGNIARQGANSLATWQGNVIAKNVLSGLGSAANDPNAAIFYNGYSAATQGRETPTDIYTSKAGVTTFMNAFQQQQRFAAGDMANPGFGGAALFNSMVKADDHILNPTYNSNIGCNFYLINRNHTKFFYMGPRKGSEFLPWTNNANGSLSQICRYVISGQYASSQPRTGGAITNINSVANY